MNQNDIKAVNELKMLAIDMINRAGGGSPGICMDMAPVMYSLFTRVLNVDPKNEQFFNRDRVILSSSHLTPLYYAMLFMAGYPITKEDLMNYRRVNSNTPGLLELNNVGVEASVSYAGDGVGISTGLSLGRRYIEALMKEEDNKVNLLDFTTYCFLSDADMMSGASEEAFSFAVAQGLNNLVFLYDANQMTGEGPLNDVLNEDITKRFLAKGFYVDTLKDSTNIREIAKALEQAKKAGKPALLIFKNVIGKDSFNEGKNIMHNGALTMDDTNSLRRKYNLFLPPFEISKDSLIHIEKLMSERTNKFFNKWKEHYARAKNINSTSLNEVLSMLETKKVSLQFLAENYKINEGYRESLIESNYKVMNLIAPKSRLFIGGSAGLSLVCQTSIGNDYLSKKTPQGRNIRFGIRERAMAHILNGLSLLGLMVYGSTELCFLDEMKSGLRMSSLMNLPVTYIFTHDSIYNSEEASARIPVEELSMLRSTPNMTVYRPSDITELMGCWQNILESNKPSSIVISKNSIPKLPGSNALDVKKGAYIIKKEVNRLDGIIIATGSEVVSAMQIAFDLFKSGIDIRVVSMPCVELFQAMGREYETQILPSNVKTAVIEASKSEIWARYATSDEYILGIDDFSSSGIPIEVLQKMNYDYDSLKLKITSLMKR